MSSDTSREHLKRQLQSLDDYDFEHFIADLWERQGWTTQVAQQSNDAGIDVRATKTEPVEQKQLIQAKRYGKNTTVGGPDIQQYASLRHQERDADSTVIVTTSRFTRSARERAEELNVKLVDGDDLVQIIEDLHAHDLVDDYAPTPTSPDSVEGVDPVDSLTQESSRLDVLDVTSDLPINTPVRISKTKWYYAIWAGVALWLIGPAIGEGAIGSTVMGVGWFGTPIAVAGDSWKAGIAGPRNRQWWKLVAFTAIPLAGIYPLYRYLMLRRQLSTESSRDAPVGPDAE